jgi:hypothetical protein
MMKQPRWFLCLFAVLMGICTLIFIWDIPASYSMAFRLSDAQLSLETAQGRERKQQAEYDKTLENIEIAKASLDAIAPQHAEVQAARDAQVAERKELKARREELRKQIDALLPAETAGEEASE